MKRICCKTCRYWRGPIPQESRFCAAEEMLRGEWGYCKRHAPRPSVEVVENTRGKAFVAVWPETQAGDVCGEFALIPLHKD